MPRRKPLAVIEKEGATIRIYDSTALWEALKLLGISASAEEQNPKPASKKPEQREADKSKMSEKQIAYIKDLLKKVHEKTGLSYEALRDMASEELGFEVSWSLTREQAAKLIDWLKKQLSKEQQSAQ